MIVKILTRNKLQPFCTSLKFNQCHRDALVQNQNKYLYGTALKVTLTGNGRAKSRSIFSSPTRSYFGPKPEKLLRWRRLEKVFSSKEGSSFLVPPPGCFRQLFPPRDREHNFLFFWFIIPSIHLGRQLCWQNAKEGSTICCESLKKSDFCCFLLSQTKSDRIQTSKDSSK